MTFTDNNSASVSDIATITIENSTPVFDVEASITPSSGVYTDTELTCSATASDADDGSLTPTYQWTVGSDIIGSTHTYTVSSSDSNVGDSIVCTATATDDNGESITSSTSVTVENTHPTFTTDAFIVPTTNIVTGTELTCSATATDIDQGGIVPTYEWTVGSTIVSTTATYTIAASDTDVGDDIICTATATDAQGDYTTSSATTTVSNSTPFFTFDASIAPSSSIVTGTELTCSATATDVDEGSIIPTYAWTVGSTTIATGPTYTISASDTDVGDSIVCSATATDSQGETALSTASVTIENTEPIFSTGASISPSSPVVGDTLTCSAEATDADDGSLTPSFAWQDENNDSLGTGATLTLTSSNSNVGEVITCVATATDGNGAQITSLIGVTVINSAPVFDTDTAISPSSGVTTISELTCSATASDADGDTPTLSYVWTNSTQSTTLGTSSTLTLTSSISQPTETIVCTVTATDDQSDTATSTSSVTVDNTEPSFTNDASISPTTAKVGDTLTCSAAATDQDEGTLPINYEWQDENGTSLGTNSTLTVTASNSNVGEDITCVATANDDQGASVSSSVSITIDNTDPDFDVAAAISPSSSVTTSTALSCSATASDVDGDTPALTYAWTNSTQNTTLGTAASLTLTPSAISPTDVVVCTVTASDPNSGSNTSTSSVTVDNTDPTLTVTISGTTTTNKANLTCGTSTSDADGESPSLTYTWTNSTQSTTLGTSRKLQLTPSLATEGDVIVCTAVATDGYGGTATDSDSLTITNIAPKVDSIIFSPSSITAADSSLICTPSTSDADGDPVSVQYAWSVDGSTQTETSAVLGGTFIAGSTIVCSVTPNDGTVDGTTVEESITVGNTAPVVDSVSLSPSSVYTNDTITASTTTSDIDTTQTITVSYAWHVIDANTGIDKTVQNSTTTTLDGSSHFDKDDEVYVVATANDGTDSSATKTSSSITILNSPPTVPVVSITPDPATAGTDDLTCSLDTISTDADGDNVEYTYTWTDPNGTVKRTLSQIPSSQDKFFGSNTTVGTWTCTVTPTDGDDDGTAGTASVSVEQGCFFDGCDSIIDLGGGVGIDLVDISGSDLEDPLGRYTLSTSFSIMTTEVTQGMFYEIMGYTTYTSQYGIGTELPNYYVSWHQAADFANSLTDYVNTQDGTTFSACYSCSNSGTISVSCSETMNPYDCDGFSLPTEAEWELAARSGTTSEFWTGEGSNLGGDYSTDDCNTSVTIQDGSLNPRLSAYAWFCGNRFDSSGSNTVKPVALKLPNDFGLYDMHGNVVEWTADRLCNTYPQSDGAWCEIPSPSPNTNLRRIMGGAFINAPSSLRSSYRFQNGSSSKAREAGFRLLRRSP